MAYARGTLINTEESIGCMAQVLYANELQTPTLALEFLEYAPDSLLGVPTYHFRMVRPGGGPHVGWIHLRAVTTEPIELYAGHLNYAVEQAHRGHRFSLQAVEMLKPLAHRLGLDPLWMTCDPDNLAAARICELAGGEFIETVTVPHRGSDGEKRRYRLRL